ncbi:MAG: HDOD domain-containing protein [Oligoflexales bacterium]
MKICCSCGNVFEKQKDILEKADRLRICEEKHFWFNCKCGSTHLIKSGNSKWFKPTLLMRDDVKHIYLKYNMVGKIPQIHSWIMRLQQVIEDERSTYSNIVNQLEKSPNIAFLTLKIASNLVPRKSEIYDLKHAIGLLGRKSLSDIVLSASLSNLPIKTREFKSKLFWENSITVGNLSRQIFNKFGKESSTKSESLAFYLGCFQNVGKLLAASLFPNKVDEVVSILEKPENQAGWDDAAIFIDIPDKSLLGEIAIATWGLPKELKNILLYFQGINEVPNKSDELHIFQCVEFATIANHWLKMNPHKIAHKTLSNIQSATGLSDESLEQMVFSLKK